MSLRHSPRIPYEALVRIAPLDGGEARVARAVDLGPGGLFVRAQADLPLGAPVRVAVPLDGARVVEAEARVARLEAGGDGRDPGMALRFENLSDAAREALEHHLQQVFAEPRLRGLYEAARGLLRGDFRPQVGDRYDDDIGRLAAMLRQIGSRMESTYDRLAKLRTLTEQINDGLVLDDILNHVYDSFRSVLPYDRIGLALVENHGRTVRTAWARSEAPRLAIAAGYAAPLAGTSLAHILETGRPRILSDLRAYARLHPKSDATQRIVAEGMRSSLTFPLMGMGRPTGFLFFSSFEPDVYTNAHIDFFGQVAGQLSSAIEKGRLYEDLLHTKERLEQTNRHLEQLARKDPLTGLANRRELEERFDRMWRRAMREGATVGALLVDVDLFKRFNDRYGHQAGDDCLRQVGGALAGAFRRPDDIIARHGGEEFAGVVTRMTKGALVARAEHVCRAVRGLAIPHADSEAASVVTVSVGVAITVPVRGANGGALLEAADVALYRAKEAGRDRVEVSDRSLRATS